MVELAWHELMTEDLRAYEAGTPQQGNFDEHDLGDYIIERKKLDFYARGYDYNGSQLHGYKMEVRTTTLSGISVRSFKRTSLPSMKD